MAVMKIKKLAPLNEDGSERECPKCHKLIYNKKEGCPQCKAPKAVNFDLNGCAEDRVCFCTQGKGKSHTHEEKTQHTPTPYHMNDSHSNFPDQIVIECEGTRIIAVLDNNDGQDRETATFIVTALNSHEELLRCLKEEHSDEINNNHYGDDLESAPCSYCTIIAKAEGK